MTRHAALLLGLLFAAPAFASPPTVPDRDLAALGALLETVDDLEALDGLQALGEVVTVGPRGELVLLDDLVVLHGSHLRIAGDLVVVDGQTVDLVGGLVRVEGDEVSLLGVSLPR